MTIYKPYGNAAYKYGNTSRLYGDGSATDDATHWAIEVDWFNTGSYDGSSEAAYAIGLETISGNRNKYEIADSGNFAGYQPPDVGTCRITLDNTSRRFDAYNTSGDLYGNILPGRFIRVRVMYHGVTYNVFHGNIARITPYDTEEKNTVVLDCEDGKRWLMNGDYNSDGIILNENPVNYALTVANSIYPSRFGVATEPIVSDIGDDLSYIWSDGNVSALSMINDLIKVNRECRWWIGEDGMFKDMGNVIIPGTHMAAVEITEENTLKQIMIAQPWEEILNVLKYTSYPRVAVTDFVMWEGLEKPLIAPGGSYTFFPIATYNNESVPSDIGSATITISANTLEDGTGTDLFLFGGVISGADATGCVLTVTSYEPTLSGYVTSIKLTGTIYAADPVVFIGEDTASIAIYGKHRLVLNNRLSQDKNLYSFFTGFSLRPSINVTMQARPDKQFGLPLYYYAVTTLPKYGIGAILGANTFIAYVNHKWLDNSGQNVLSNFILHQK
jgi:hypothetical protein